MKEINLDIECQSCGGQGVYRGMGETDGASVVCRICKGTGCQNYTFKYKKFNGRVKNDKIKRVFISGYGYCVGVTSITLDNGVFVDFSKEGVSYEEFLNGKMPKHIKQMACPMRADQGACHKIGGFVEECDQINGGYIGYIPNCKSPNKSKCWDRFENN